MPMQDARTGALIINTGLRGEHALSREFFIDGTSKKSFRAQGRDAVHDAHASHKPGYRQPGTGQQQLKDAAYEEMCRDLSEAWKSPEQRAQDTASARPVTADTRSHGGAVDARDAAYAEMVDDLTNQWRPKDSVDVTKAGTAAAKVPPLAAYPLSAGEGNPCFQDGSSGTLRRVGDWLVCELDPPLSSRVPATNPSSADGQAIKDAAWNEMVSELSSAWKS